MKKLLALLAALFALSVGLEQAIAGPKPGFGGSTPAISGVGIVGQVLSVPSYAGATYQWKRDGANISGATSNTYTTVTADGGHTVSVAITVAGKTVTAALAISGTPVTTATLNQPYTGFSYGASGGTSPYTYSLSPSSGALPTGITLNSSTGAVAGTPTASGTFSNIIGRVTDSLSATNDASPFTLTVNNVTFTTSLGAAFTPDVEIGSTTTLGITNGKTETLSYWFLGSSQNATKATSAVNATPFLTYASDSLFGCEIGNGTSSHPAKGVCLTLTDNSSAKFQHNFNDATGFGGSSHGGELGGTGTYSPVDLQWMHVLVSVDDHNQVGAAYINGVDQIAAGKIGASTIPLDMIIDQNGGLHMGGAGLGYFWLADAYLSQSSWVCPVGASSITVDGNSYACPDTLGNKIPQALRDKVYDTATGKGVDLGTNCTGPTGTQPFGCFTGTGATPATNHGPSTATFAVQRVPMANSSYTNSHLFTPTYGPAGATAHQATPKWVQVDLLASGTTSTTTSAGGGAIATGDFLMLVEFNGDNATNDEAPQCPTGATSTWTSQGTAFDNGLGGVLGPLSINVCTATAAAAETGAITYTWTAGSRRNVGWMLINFGQTTAGVDVAGGNPNHTSSTSILTKSLTTTVANDTLLSLAFDWNAGNNTLTFPTGVTGPYASPTGVGSAILVGLGVEYGIASGANTQRTFTLGSSSTSIGFTIALKPN